MTIAVHSRFDNTSSGAASFDIEVAASPQPRGCAVVIVEEPIAEPVTSVTVGGIALTQKHVVTGAVASSEMLNQTIRYFLLPSGMPTGTVTVEVDGPTVPFVVGVIVFTAANTIVEQNFATLDVNPITNPSIPISLGGKTCYVGMIFQTGAPSPPAAAAGWTARIGADGGPECWCYHDRDAIDSTDATGSWVQTGEDAMALVFALTEAEGGSVSDIAGTATLTFGGSASLVSVSGLTASASMGFSTAAPLKGTGNVIGLATLLFTGAAATVPGQLGGHGPVTFGQNAVLTAMGVLEGTAPLSLSLTGTPEQTGADTGTLTGTGKLEGETTLIFAGIIGVPTAITGTAPLTIGSAAHLTTFNPLAGTAAHTLAAQGAMIALGTLEGHAASTLTGNATATGGDLSRSTAHVTFAAVGTMTATGKLAGEAHISTQPILRSSAGGQGRALVRALIRSLIRLILREIGP